MHPKNRYPEGFFLMIRRKEAPEGTIAFPAGRVEASETPEQAVIREVDEEVGLVINVAAIKLLTTLHSINLRRIGHPKPVLSQKKVYRVQVPESTLWGLADWKQDYTGVDNPEAPFWDSMYFEAPVDNHPEVASYLLFHESMLYHLTKMREQRTFLTTAPDGFFKDDVIVAAAHASQKIWRKNVRLATR